MSRPLVSAITGSYPPRLDLLIDAMRNLRESTYPNLEHCIAIEGEPGEVDGMIARIEIEASRLGCRESTRVVGLGRHWSSFLAMSISAVPFQVAQWMARGDLLMWFSDDERASPDHIESLVDLLEETESDFVYPYVRIVFRDGLPYAPRIVGAHPPEHGQVTNALYRADLLDYRGFVTHIGSGTDWDQANAWVQAGARSAMLDRVTYEHRVDKMGEGDDYRTERRPLRGQQPIGAHGRLP